MTFSDVKGGYGGGAIDYNFNFNANTPSIFFMDSGLPSFPEEPWQLWAQKLDITGNYTELDWGCCAPSTPPGCCPQKFTGTISPFDKYTGFMLGVEKNPLTNNLEFSLLLTPDIDITGSWTPKGCCIQQDTDPMTFNLTGGVLAAADSCGKRGVSVPVTYNELRTLKKITRTFQYTLNQSCCNKAGFITYAPNAQLTWNATLEIDIQSYIPHTPPSVSLEYILFYLLE